jgi:DNA-binding transcriptional ArsR family regulator
MVAHALSEPTRWALLQALMAGPSSVSALVRGLGLSPTNGSNHLGVLRAAGLVSAKRRGRVVEYAIASPAAAQLIESLSVLSGPAGARARTELAEARTCYDHLAGRLGVALFEQLRRAGALASAPSGRTITLGRNADRSYARLGVAIDQLVPTRRRPVYACLDWTERRPHLGGAVGAAIAQEFFRRRLVRRRRGSRGLDVSPAAWRLVASLGERA